MTRDAHLVLAVVTSARGVLLLHRQEQQPPAFFPGARPEKGEQPGSTAERGVLEEARMPVRTGRVLGRHVHPNDRRPVIYVAATPIEDVTAFGSSLESLHMGWYLLDQVDLLLPDLHGPVRKHLVATIRTR